jgi:hypothetical protein
MTCSKARRLRWGDIGEPRQGLGRRAQIGQRRAQLLGGGAQQPVAPVELGDVPGHVGQGQDIARRRARTRDQGHPPAQQGARIDRGADQRRRHLAAGFGAVAVHQAVQRMQDGFARHQVEQ